MMALTNPQRARLEKLAAYLEGLPKGYRHFGMAFWLANARTDAVIEYALKNGGVSKCGTSACAAGHGPAAGVLVPKRFVSDYYVDWASYSRMFVGHENQANLWCFGGQWDRVDNHHYGAAARIRYLLNKGKPPSDYVGAAHRRFRPLYAPYRIDAEQPA